MFSLLELDNVKDTVEDDCDFLIKSDMPFVAVKAFSMLIYPKPIILIDKLSGTTSAAAASSCSPISVPQE